MVATATYDSAVIRNGTPKGFYAISELVGEFYNESIAEFGIELDRTSILNAMKDCVEHSLFLEIGSKIVGVIAGKIIDVPLQQRKVFQEYIWFISKPYRRYGIRLLKAMEKKCKDLGLSHIIMTQMVNAKSGQLDRLYKRQGYRDFEIQYIKEL